jgi:hypothetical protein
MSSGIMIALKITADRMADVGDVRFMKSSAFRKDGVYLAD